MKKKGGYSSMAVNSVIPLMLLDYNVSITDLQCFQWPQEQLQHSQATGLGKKEAPQLRLQDDAFQRDGNCIQTSQRIRTTLHL